MAKHATKTGPKALVIVESPAKARTIGGFLGRDFVIEASIGHVRDLPQGAKQIPEQYKKTDWAYLGVNVNENFSPVYVVPPEKAQQVRKLKALVKDAQELYLATDEDREGEAISWHLYELLKPKIPVRRLVFHEITKEAIHEALEQPRQIDQDLVRAQEARRILDRLVGYDVSPLLWRKVRPKLSAGRVQSVAVRLIVERERERMAFVSASYWDLLGTFAKSQGQTLDATLVRLEGRSIATSKDFDPATGKLKNPKQVLLNEREALELVTKLKGASFTVASLEDKPYTSKPYPPFTTSTLQQEANRKLGFTAQRAMRAAQSLYETGHITYMRTDSTNLAAVAIEAARELVASQYGREYLPDQPRLYRTKVKNAQEAHEAIRPAGHPFALPESLRRGLSDDEFKIYDLVWKRTVASQMADARGRRISIVIQGGGAEFQVGGKTIDFPGYLRAYVEGADDPQAELADRETILPHVDVGERLSCRELEAKGHATQPPSRFNEATLIRELEGRGIGRPSTYASIIATIQERDYVFKRGNALVPTWTAIAVTRLLEQHLPDLVDFGFTAQMEDDLDAISRGEKGHVDYLRQFYFGNGHAGLKQQLANKQDQIDARDVSRIPLVPPQRNSEPNAGRPSELAANGADPIFVRVGRYGPFLEQGSRRASIPDGLPPDELTVESALTMLERSAQADEPLGTCPTTGKPVFLKTGRFGPYVQLGRPDDGEKPKNASLLSGMKPEEVDLDMALRLLSLPRNLGAHPDGASPLAGQTIDAKNGPYGPYVQCGKETRSLPADVSPLDVSLDQAVKLLAEPKKARRGQQAAREPLKIFDNSPITSKPVHLLEGRYGPYVTDTVTLASIPKGTPPEEVTFEQALNLLAERAAKGPPSKARGRRRAPRAAASTKSKPAAPRKKASAPRKKPAAKRKSPDSAATKRTVT